MTWPTNNSFTPLPTRFSSKYVFTSKAHAIESSGRFWEVEEILHMRKIRGRGLHARRVKQYLVRWALSLLSASELHYTQKTWKIAKTSQDVHAEKGEALDQKMRVEWAPSWISSHDFGPWISATEIASHLLSSISIVSYTAPSELFYRLSFMTECNEIHVDLFAQSFQVL